MKYDLKLYLTFDADLISLNAAGISVPEMIRIALEHRVRGKRAHFLVTECPSYELTGRKRMIHTSVKITDPLSIEFLKNEIKPWQRSAFFRAIVREALIYQAVGVYLKNKETIQKESRFIGSQDTGAFSDVIVLKPKKKKRDYAKEILHPAESNAEKEKENPGGHPVYRNSFGDVSDLSIAGQMKKKKEQEKREEIKEQAGSMPPDEKEAPAAGVPEDPPAKDGGPGPAEEELPFTGERTLPGANAPSPDSGEKTDIPPDDGEDGNDQTLMELFMSM